MKNYEKKKRPLWLDYDQKTADLTEEEKAIRKENLECRKNIGYEGMKKLQDAIALRAIIDYQNALTLKSKDKEETIKECEEYFRTDAFKASTGIKDPKKVKQMILKIPVTYSLERMMK